MTFSILFIAYCVDKWEEKNFTELTDAIGMTGLSLFYNLSSIIKIYFCSDVFSVFSVPSDHMDLRREVQGEFQTNQERQATAAADQYLLS